MKAAGFLIVQKNPFDVKFSDEYRKLVKEHINTPNSLMSTLCGVKYVLKSINKYEKIGEEKYKVYGKADFEFEPWMTDKYKEIFYSSLETRYLDMIAVVSQTVSGTWNVRR